MASPLRSALLERDGHVDGASDSGRAFLHSLADEAGEPDAAEAASPLSPPSPPALNAAAAVMTASTTPVIAGEPHSPTAPPAAAAGAFVACWNPCPLLLLSLRGLPVAAVVAGSSLLWTCFHMAIALPLVGSGKGLAGTVAHSCKGTKKMPQETPPSPQCMA